MTTPSSPAGITPGEGSGEVRPPATRPAAPPAGGERHVRIGEEQWIARLEGTSAAGNGSYNLAMVAAVRFSRASDPERPILEVLLAAGRFSTLFESELVELFGRARPLGEDR
jgi:hypothetical protein